MFGPRGAARIRTVAVILMLLALGFIATANAKRQIQPGTAYIRITSQVIKKNTKGTTKVTASALYNKRISPYAIGNSISDCTQISNHRTLPRDTQLCHVIFRMPLGQIVAFGVKSSSVYYRLAVVGGTGVYKNIGGHVQGITTRLKPRREKLVFTIIAFKEIK